MDTLSSPRVPAVPPASLSDRIEQSIGDPVRAQSAHYQAKHFRAVPWRKNPMFLADLDWEGLSRIVPAASKRLRVWFSCGWKGNALALAVAFLTACGSSTPGGSNVSIRLDRTEITLAPGETQLFTA